MPDIEARMVQQKPAAWDGMVARVTAAINPSLPHELQFDAAQVACAEVDGRMAEGSDKRNHHYALGLAACEFAMRVFTPEGAEMFVEEAAAALTERHAGARKSETGESGLAIADLIMLSFMHNKTFGEQPLPQPERILADALSLRNGRQPGVPPSDTMLGYILERNETAGRVRGASIAGALSVLREVLGSYYESVHGERPRLDMPLRDIIDGDTFDKLDLKRAAKLSANMSANRLGLIIESLISVDAEAHVHVDGDLARKQRALSNGASCPVLHVAVRREPEEGLVRAVVSLVPYVTGLLMRAVSTAQHRLVPDW
jgi:hypothetical protein